MVKNQYDNITGEHQYVGSFWARQQFLVDAAHAGKSARLLVGTLFDADYTFVNGQEVGRTYYQYPPRRYTIPAGVLKEGANALTIRFITKGGNPHFIKDKPYKLVFEDGYEIPLSAQWHVHEGARMFNCPQADVAPNNLPSVLYNAMLYPLAPYSLAGVTWYQGESNTNEGDLYRQMLGELVLGWRQLWKDASLPFVIVQLANFMAPTDQPQDTGWSHVREAQRLATQELPHTALAVTIDLGEEVDIHPLLKREVAQRIAKGFEKLLWDKKLQLSPEVVASETNGDKIVLTLDQPLRSDGSLQTFEVAAGDGRFMNAEAESCGNRIIVHSPVNHPVTVRYAWKNNPVKANAYGRNALPMSPFQLKLSR
jgi:sialate O-acetylesterase